jgi:hypothetical protein
MNLTQLWKVNGFDTDEIIIVRHTDHDDSGTKVDMKLLYSTGMIEFYQSIQSKKRFDNCDFVVSFIGGKGTEAKYIGAYEKIGKRKDFDKNTMPDKFPYKDIFSDGSYQYQLNKIDVLNDVIDQMIIEG